MSRSYNSKQVNSSKPVSKFCKVCQDAGKTEAEYRSHFTRETPEPSSKVVCPTLLALECRFCFEKGHTVKYCKVLKQVNKEAARTERHEIEKAKKVIEKPKGKPNNMFTCLVDDSGSDEEELSWAVACNKAAKKIPVVEDFPSLGLGMTRAETVDCSYASVLAKPAPQKNVVFWKAVELPKKTQVKAEQEQDQEEDHEPKAFTSKYGKASLLDWTAWESDSSDEDW